MPSPRAYPRVRARELGVDLGESRAEIFIVHHRARAATTTRDGVGFSVAVSSRVLTRHPRDSVRERTRDADPPRGPRECAPRVEPVASVARDRRETVAGIVVSSLCERSESARARRSRVTGGHVDAIDVRDGVARLARVSRGIEWTRPHRARARWETSFDRSPRRWVRWTRERRWKGARCRRAGRGRLGRRVERVQERLCRRRREDAERLRGDEVSE